MKKRLLCSLALLVISTPASAQGYESVYSSIAVDDCLMLTPPDLIEEYQGAEWVCAGQNGLVVWVGEGDLRMFLGYGPDGREQCSYTQTMSGFNSAHDTLEWRLRSAGGVTQPIATILRYTVNQPDGQDREFLVVTKLGAQSCHMAYVSASEANHNVTAREAADRFAESFDCARDIAFNYSAQGRDGSATPGANYTCPPLE